MCRENVSRSKVFRPKEVERLEQELQKVEIKREKKLFQVKHFFRVREKLDFEPIL
jgi:hypothetical protein